MQTHPYLVQGWNLFDWRSRHGLVKMRRSTWEWDGREATWERVMQGLEADYFAGDKSPLPLTYSLKQMYADMMEAWKKLTLYAEDYRAAKKPYEEQTDNERHRVARKRPEEFAMHYEKHCRRYNALLKYFKWNRSEINYLASDKEVIAKTTDRLLQIQMEVETFYFLDPSDPETQRRINL